MGKDLKISVAALVITISLLLILVLFYIYVVNTKRITNIMDQKTALQNVVTTLSHVLENVGGKVDTTKGEHINHQNTPALAELLDSLERVLVLPKEEAYVFIMDTTGQEIVNGGNPELARAPDGSRPYRNLSGVADGSGEKLTEKILQTAAAGGGFVEYSWKNPHTKKMGNKVAYVRTVPGTEWVVGSGIYMDSK